MPILATPAPSSTDLTSSVAVPKSAVSPTLPTREQFAVAASGEPDLAFQVQRPGALPARADVVYVHGATFGADLSIYFGFDGQSWADHLTAAGFAVWGFDFVGFGRSARYPADLDRPAGNIDDAMRDLRRVIGAVRERNGGKPVALLAHSRGAAVAARYTGEYPADVSALVLFAPVVRRPASGDTTTNGAALSSHYPLSVWAQYRRFIEDVPRGRPQVLNEEHMQPWGAAFLASDLTSAQRMPPSVMTPMGPIADIRALWSGAWLYDPAKIEAPTLIVRGEWDAVCGDADARHLIDGLSARIAEDAKVPRATHLMHLEQQRAELHARVNEFLQKVLP
jgi:pimeloyl-ACP methyl ester carboxylesterase